MHVALNVMCKVDNCYTCNANLDGRRGRVKQIFVNHHKAGNADVDGINKAYIDDMCI